MMRKTGNINNVLIPLFLSLSFHFVFLYFIFLPGNGNNHVKSNQVSVADKLDSADTFILEEIQRSKERIMRKIGEINLLRQEEFKGRWTKTNMPERIQKAFQRIGRDIVEVKITPSLFKKGSSNQFSVLVRLMTTPRLVFEDLILLSYIAGDGTLRSDFKTDYLLLAVKEKGRTGSRDFIVTTMDCRLLYAKKLSAQQLVTQATIEDGKHW